MAINWSDVNYVRMAFDYMVPALKRTTFVFLQQAALHSAKEAQVVCTIAEELKDFFQLAADMTTKCGGGLGNAKSDWNKACRYYEKTI
jgi:hypothetical protein